MKLMAMTGAVIPAAVFGSSEIGDPEGTRTVYAIIALLVVMGLSLVMLAFWLRRSTRPDPELLAPLEAMGQRSWLKRDPVWQRRRLDEVRPDDAEPLQRASAPPLIDSSFDAGPSGSGFDDLRDSDADPTTATATGATEPGPGPDEVTGSSPLTGSDTPTASQRPIDDLLAGDIDPTALERAMAELDDELRDRSDP